MSPATGSRKASFYAGRVPSPDMIAVGPDGCLRRNLVV
jgi:hypothetical protein